MGVRGLMPSTFKRLAMAGKESRSERNARISELLHNFNSMPLSITVRRIPLPGKTVSVNVVGRADAMWRSVRVAVLTGCVLGQRVTG